MNAVSNVACKICGSSKLDFFAHTATCQECGVLLCYPYPSSDAEQFATKTGRQDVSDADAKRHRLEWSLKSGDRRHLGFTEMVRFTMTEDLRFRPIKVLDYGGGGQFGLVLKSMYPLADVYITDIRDVQFLDQFRPMSTQIKFADFDRDGTKFDVIFMNDVFEHLSDPMGVLSALRGKLAGPDAKIFIDTPRQFWIYPATKFVWKKLHTKVLRGTVDYDHQQIWSRKAFSHVAREAGFEIFKYAEVSEFTQPPDFYLDAMKITNPVIRFFGKRMYRLGRAIAKNKILAVLRPVRNASTGARVQSRRN